MRKRLSSMSNEHGFILPVIWLIVLLSFFLVGTMVQMYQNEMDLTKQNLEQLKVETLFQMGYEQFSQEYRATELTSYDEIYYQFPEGEVIIQFLKLNEQEGQLLFRIETDEQSYVTFIKPLQLT